MAREVEERLRGEDGAKLLAAVEQRTAERWKEGLAGFERARAALAGFVRLRTLDRAGRMCAGFSGPPQEAPKGCRPWFAVRGRRSAGVTVIFGHWAALGLQDRARHRLPRHRLRLGARAHRPAAGRLAGFQEPAAG